MMKALRLENIGELKLRQLLLPKPGQDEILLKVTHCALCKTDAKMSEKGHRDLILPRILGHEICGLSEKRQERFVVWPGKACGDCSPCQGGEENLCEKMQITGFHRDGGLADHVIVPEASLIPVPDDLPSEIATLAEPMACAINAIQQTGIKEGDKVLIYGAGPLGLMLATGVQKNGAYPFITESDPDKLIKSEAFRSEIRMKCVSEHPPFHFDGVINAAPSTESFLKGTSVLRPGGCFCLFSGLTDELVIPISVINEIHYRQLQVKGAYGCTRAQMKNALLCLCQYKDIMKHLIEAHIRLADVSSVLPKIRAGKALKYIVQLA